MNIAAREPIATRELRQAARQKRGPLLLGGVAVCGPLLALLVSAVMTSPWTSPADIGRVVFEAVLTLAIFVVVIVGVTVAGSSVASEREGHTWEALLLSGLRPSAIVRGKFLGAFAQAVLYLAALAPSAALAFLVGGVTVTEIIVAFVLVLAVAAVAVLFGLAVSSYARTARGALAGVLVATLIVFPAVYGAFTGLGFMVGDLMGDSSTRGSTWLAHAIVAAPLGARSFVFFALDPLIALVVPGWLVLELTKANLSDPSDDRSTGLRRWYVIATLLLVIGSLATLLAVPSRHDLVAVGLLLLIAVHVGLSSLLFCGEPLAPSRRVVARGAATTFAQKLLGPGVATATALNACLGAAALAIVLGFGTSLAEDHVSMILDCARYAVAFHLFVAGASGALAVRFQRPTFVRCLVIAGMLVLIVIPPFAGSVGRVLTGGGDGWRLLEAVSPVFPLMAGPEPDGLARVCGHVATIGYGVIGILLVLSTWAMVRARAARSTATAP